MLLAWEALPWRCSLEAGSPGSCPDAPGAAPERARWSSVASMVSPVCTVPPEKLGAVCRGPETAQKSAHDNTLLVFSSLFSMLRMLSLQAWSWPPIHITGARTVQHLFVLPLV